MSSLDKYQILTLAFGATVVILSLAAYNDSELNDNLSAARAFMTVGLPYLFAAYALCSVSARKEDEQRMYKNIILGITIVSWFLAVWKKLTPFGGLGSPPENAWDRVQEAVVSPLAVGAFFALPVALIGFRV
jgi:uncharacterized membrane protein